MNETVIDIIILSYAQNSSLKSLTDQTIRTLLNSENPSEIKFNVVVIESNKNIAPFQFANSTTIYPDEKFGFHKYLNIGIRATKNRYVCLCNNDLIFHKQWASKILRVFDEHPQYVSANPLCDQFKPHKPLKGTTKIIEATKKNIFNGVLTGWCIFSRRSLFDKIGFLDEQFDFWYADRDYGRTLLSHKLKHILVPTSVVTHLGNQSHSSITPSRIDDFTTLALGKYKAKWDSSESLVLRIQNKLKKILRS